VITRDDKWHRVQCVRSDIATAAIIIIIIRDSQKKCAGTTLSVTLFFVLLPLARAEAIGLSIDLNRSEC